MAIEPSRLGQRCVLAAAAELPRSLRLSGSVRRLPQGPELKPSQLYVRSAAVPEEVSEAFSPQSKHLTQGQPDKGRGADEAQRRDAGVSSGQ